jgi:acetyl-CoA carboxylase carboxyltransferase component
VRSLFRNQVTDPIGISQKTGPEDERIGSLLDPSSIAPLDFPSSANRGALLVATGAVLGRPVVVTAFARELKRGAIGVEEAAALEGVFEQVRTRSVPLVLLLDSSGARIDQGLEILAAFRRLLGAALRARFAGVRAIAVVRSNCYGGASMLAYLAERRIFTAASRIGMSGPSVIAAAANPGELDPSDAAAIEALLGGASRARLIATDLLCAERWETLRETLAKCLSEPPCGGPSFSAEKHRALFERLGHLGIDLPRSPRPAPPEIKQRIDSLLGEGFETILGAGLVRGVRLRAGREITITGVVQGAPLTAVASWMLAESIITSVRARPERPIVILYDSPGHAATRVDESALLSDYLVHLAQTVLWAEEQGVRVSVWLMGDASGGGYVALTAACRHVLALPGARIRVLPEAAVASVLRAEAGDTGGPARWLELGLVDQVLQEDTLPEDVVWTAGLAPSR